MSKKNNWSSNQEEKNTNNDWESANKANGGKGSNKNKQKNSIDNQWNS